MTTAHRGGFGFAPHSNGFYAGRAGGFVRNRALSTAGGRVFTGQLQRFAVSADAETGAHSITLANNEVAAITVNEDASTTMEIANKPTAGANDNGGNGNGAAAPRPAEAEAGLHSYRRSLASRIVSRMSWERNPADGSVTFVPDKGEVFDADGDAVMATVAAVPTRPAL